MNQTPTQVEIAWLAGLLEGEGCFYSYRNRKQQEVFNVQLSMSDLDVVEQVARLFGGTKVYTSIKPPPRKTAYITSIRAHAAIRLMKLVLPYMGKRRAAKIRQLIELWGGSKRRRERGTPPVCHPERPHRALELCAECYLKQYHEQKKVAHWAIDQVKHASDAR